MTENAPSPVFYASAKPEALKMPQKEDSKLVKSVKNTLNKWWERVGPKSIESRFIKAHTHILNTLNNDQRKEAYAQTAEQWKKTGKIVGITATVVDAGIVGLGLGLTYLGLKNPENTFVTGFALAHRVATPLRGNELLDTFMANKLTPLSEENRSKYINKLGKNIATIPSLGSLGILLGSGPGHWLAHLAGMSAEQMGKMKARTNNYVDSGKAAEHAAKVGNALGKAATETAKWAAEHPDEIRKTVETVSKVKKEHAESAQKIAQAKQKAADAKLDAEYADWVAHHPDKTYFEQSGTPPPSKAEYVEMKAREAAAKKANKEAEERGVAKKSIFS